MKKTQPPVSPFNSQPALFARVCLPAPWQAGLPVRTRAPKPHCAVAVTKNLSAAISTLTHKPFYRQSSPHSALHRCFTIRIAAAFA
jgi:hypothetical protein